MEFAILNDDGTLRELRNLPREPVEKLAGLDFIAARVLPVKDERPEIGPDQRHQGYRFEVRAGFVARVWEVVTNSYQEYATFKPDGTFLSVVNLRDDGEINTTNRAKNFGLPLVDTRPALPEGHDYVRERIEIDGDRAVRVADGTKERPKPPPTTDERVSALLRVLQRKQVIAPTDMSAELGTNGGGR